MFLDGSRPKGGGMVSHPCSRTPHRDWMCVSLTNCWWNCCCLTSCFSEGNWKTGQGYRGTGKRLPVSVSTQELTSPSFVHFSVI